jgi:predicted hotdog family 3-hydroxylacyl-ACP dehydratase
LSAPENPPTVPRVPAGPRLPHSARLLIVDWVVGAVTENGGQVEALIRADGPYFENGGFQHQWYVEFMAQAVGAIFNSASHAGSPSHAPKFGYLIKIDAFELVATTPPRVGDTLVMTVALVTNLHPVGEYAVELSLDGAVLARGGMKFLVEA